MKIIRDDNGIITAIESTGIFPGKRKIENCEIDTKLSLFDFNLFKK